MKYFLRIIERITGRFPVLTLCAIFAFTMGMGYMATKLHVANDPQDFLPNHPLAQTAKHIEAQFGASSFAQTIYVLFVPKPKSGQTLESMQAVMEMESVLQALRSVKGIQSAMGIPDHVKALRRELHGGKAEYAQLPPKNSDDDYGYSFDQLVRLTLQRVSLAKRLVSAQGTAIATATIAKGSDLMGIAREVEKRIEPLRKAARATDTYVYSYGATLNLFNNATRSDVRFFAPLVAALALFTLAWVFRYTDIKSLLTIGLLLVGITGILLANNWVWAAAIALAILGLVIWSFRRLSNLYLPLGVVLIAGIWTFGLLGVSGQPLNFLMLAVIPLLLGVGIDYPVYMLYRYEEERQQGIAGPQAISIAALKVGLALVLTTATTIAGFSSLIGIDSPPVQAFGMLSNLAVASSFFVTLLLVPAVKQLMRERPRPAGSFEQNRLGQALARYASWVNRRTVAVMILLLAAAASLYFLFDGHSVKTIAYDPRRLLPADAPLVQLYNRINDEFHTYDEVQILIEGEVTQLEALRSLILDIPARLSGSPYTKNFYSIAQYVDDLRSTNSLVEKTYVKKFNDQGPSVANLWVFDYIYSRPELRQEAESLLKGDGKDHYTALLMRVNTLKSPDQTSIRQVAEDITQRLSEVKEQLNQSGLRMTITGAPFLQTLSLSILQDSLYRSIGISLLLCALILMLALRSIRWALVCLIPVALSSWLVIGTISFLGLTLSVATAMVTAISIGLGVDYAIHWVERYREERDLGQATARTGEALFGDYLTTLAAFISLIFGQILWNRDFGILAAIAITYAFGLTIFVFPALVTLVRPWLPAPKEG